MKHLFCFLIFFYSLSKCQDIYRPTDTANYVYKKTLLSKLDEDKKAFIQSVRTEPSEKRKVYNNLYNSIFDGLIRDVNNNEIYSYPKLEDYIRSIVSQFTSYEENAKRLKIMISRDEVKNAYMTINGTLIFNQNFLTILENENQLAAVLAHELGHNVLAHSKNKVDKYVQISTDDELISEARQIKKQKFNKNKEAESLLKSLVYNNQKKRREDEIDADKKSLEILKGTKYSTSEILKLLKILETSDIEKDSLTTEDFRKILSLESADAKLFSGEGMSEYTSIDENFFKWNIDSLKTHPSCEERINIVKNLEGNQNPVFEKNHSMFQELKQAAELENIQNAYLLKNYGRSLYFSMLYLKKHPNDRFAANMLSENLKQLKIARESKNYGKYIIFPNPKEHSRSEQLFYTFFDNISNAYLDKLVILSTQKNKP
ncbi:M48 family metalloprotease [Epilithonimonas hominis]|uniref:M48 family metalloprotease n=1 Tax=Epilithonimonas hominis TaxID=420404 RepID=UPI0011CDB9CA|nr:M48 family metalloprotease [Epilithonimonas hominis]